MGVALANSLVEIVIQIKSLVNTQLFSFSSVHMTMARYVPKILSTKRHFQMFSSLLCFQSRGLLLLL